RRLGLAVPQAQGHPGQWADGGVRPPVPTDFDRDHCAPGPGRGHVLREGLVGVGVRLLLGRRLLLLDRRLVLGLGRRLLLLGCRAVLGLGRRLLLLGCRAVLGRRLLLGHGLPLRGPLLMLLIDRRLVLGHRLLL